MKRANIDSIASALIDAYDSASTLPPITARRADFDVAAAYDVLHAIEARRRVQGWVPVGRKIGFTNRTLWARYGVDRAMWAHVFAHTVRDAASGRATLALAGLVQPRIEPEVVFGLAGGAVVRPTSQCRRRQRHRRQSSASAWGRPGSGGRAGRPGPGPSATPRPGA